MNSNKQKLLWGTSEKTVVLLPYFVCNAATTPENKKLGGTRLFEPQQAEITLGNQQKEPPVRIHSYPNILCALVEMLFFQGIFNLHIFGACFRKDHAFKASS